MKLPRFASITSVTILIGLTFGTNTFAQTASTAEWSSRVWAAASEGNWDAVDTLFGEVPEGKDKSLASFRSHLDAFRSHRETEAADTISARDEALIEMNTQMAEDNIVKAMQAAVKAQTLSNNLDDIMFLEDVQAVLSKTQLAIDDHISEGNLLTAQTLLYYLRTFYEGTSRRDLFERWNDRLEAVAIQVSLLRQYAPEHLHALFVERAEVLGDDPPEEFNAQASDNWIERVDGIDKSMVVRSLDIAISEHIADVSWEELIKGGLDAVNTLGNVPVISETFEHVSDSRARYDWAEAIQDEYATYAEYLEHLSGKQVLIQTLKRILEVNKNTLQLPEGVILREFGDGAMSKLDKYSSIIWPDESRRFEQQTEGRFVGVGIVIKENNRGEIMVVNPIEGSTCLLRWRTTR